MEAGKKMTAEAVDRRWVFNALATDEWDKPTYIGGVGKILKRDCHSWCVSGPGHWRGLRTSTRGGPLESL